MARPSGFVDGQRGRPLLPQQQVISRRCPATSTAAQARSHERALDHEFSAGTGVAEAAGALSPNREDTPMITSPHQNDIIAIAIRGAGR
jgi:hypothetical protein